MATSDNPQKGDIGTVFYITIKKNGVVVPLQTATVKTFKFIDPAGVITEKTASFSTDGSNGVLKYTTIEGDLHTAGEWKIRPYVSMPTWTGHAKKVPFTVDDVEENTEDPEIPN